jgi:lipoate---protein ligase
MYCLNSDSTDPFFNLAVEELLLKNSREEYLILYINGPSVIIGKHQTGHREVDTRFVTENHIPVIRRISGGGTVYHDAGNLNFTFISQSESGHQIDFPRYTEPVIRFLHSIGVEAKFEGKNDLKVNGLKISGNAEHIYRTRVLHHGTLLFSTSLNMLRNSIRKNTSCYSSRAVASNPSSVVNLNEMTDYTDISDFRSIMNDYMIRNLELVPIGLPEEIKKEAAALALLKYKTWEWNWGYGPEYAFENHFIYDNESQHCRLFVKDGLIVESSIDGSKKLKEIESKLIGSRHMAEDISQIFRKEGIEIDIFNFF